MKVKLLIAITATLHMFTTVFSQTQNDSIENLIKDLRSESDKIELLINLSNDYYKTDYNLAEHYAQNALEITRKVSDLKYLNMALLTYGKVLSAKGNYESALDVFSEALEINYDSTSNALSQYSMGRIYFFLQDYVKSSEYLIDALKIQEELNDTMQAKSINIIGLNNMYQSQFPEAAIYFKTALNLEKKGNDHIGLSNTLTNLGILYRRIYNYDSSRYYYNEALKVATKANDIKRQANALNNYGLTYVYEQRSGEGIEYILQALKLKETLGDITGIFRGYFNLGTIHTDLREYDKAREYLKKAIEIRPEENIHLEVYDILSQIDAAKGNYASAFENFKHFHDLKIANNNARVSKQFNELQIKYETEKKEETIKSQNQQLLIQNLKLKQRRNFLLYLGGFSLLIILLAFVIYNRYKLRVSINNLLEDKNLQLTELNATKNMFFSIVSHDLRNPSNAFKNITEALYENLENLDKDELTYYIKELNQSSNRLNLFLTNLLDWAKSQQESNSIDLETFNLKNIITESFQVLETISKLKNIELINNVDSLYNITSNKNALSTILNNLLTNALKFTPNNKSITVSSSFNTKEHTITIADQGIGMTQEEIDKLFKIEVDTTSIGNSSEKGSGLGLKICAELIKKLGGRFEVTSKLNQGSKFVVLLPNKKTLS